MPKKGVRMEIGDKVEIYNTTFGGRTVKEGIAYITKIIKPAGDHDAWYCQVRFQGEVEKYERWVMPGDIS